MNRNFYTKSLTSFILSTPLSVTVALVFANWKLMPQLTVFDVIVGVIPLMAYVFICTIIYPLPFYYLFFIALSIVEKYIKNKYLILLILLISGILCCFYLRAIDGLWRFNLQNEVAVSTFTLSVIFNIYFIYVRKIDFCITKLKSFYYSQLIISLLILVFSFKPNQLNFENKPLFQRGTYHQNIRIPLLATGNNAHFGFAPLCRQDPQYDLKTFAHETGIPVNDVLSINRIGYYNTGMCIQAKLDAKKLHLFKKSLPPHKLEQIKAGTCFRISDHELYAPRDFQGQLLDESSNILWGTKKFILIDELSNTVSLLVL